MSSAYSSDSLDDQTSRKRQRRLSCDLGKSAENANDLPATATSTTSTLHVPSRIKRKPTTRSSAINETTKVEDESSAKLLPVSVAVERSKEPVDSSASFASPATFDALGVKPALVRSLANMAIRVPTAIQTGCIPAILRGHDCIGGSRTGSGKTVAFAVPILQALAADPSVIFALVLTPTRELALQIFEQFKALGSRQTLKIALVTGGFDMRKQATELFALPHIVVATPGRLADHVRSSGADTMSGFGRVRFLVMDEADRLLAEGPGSMIPDIAECLSVLPPAHNRQTLLFTATMTPAVLELRNKPTRPGKLPVHVCEVDGNADGGAEDNGGGGVVPPTLHQTYIKAPNKHKVHYLHELLSTAGNVDKTTIVFVNKAHSANVVCRTLRLLGHRVTALHSGLPQHERVDNLGRFRAAAARVLVATDVASRGLDISEVSLVINFDVPRDPDDYVHRVGRTARAGRKGESITFIGDLRDPDRILAIEDRVGAKMVEWHEDHVNIEGRVLRDSLSIISHKKIVAQMDAEEGRDASGKALARVVGKRKLKII